MPLPFACGQSFPESFRLPKHGKTIVVAHRGAHDGVPENTMAAYARAIEIGCDFLEVDIRTTKDGQLVSIHDATVDRYTVDGSKGTVADMTLEQLQKIDIGSRVDSKWKEERIPTLTEILKLCKGKIGVYLDVKAASIESIHRLVKEQEMESDTLWFIPSGKVKELRSLSTRCWPMPDPGPEQFLQQLIKECQPKTIASASRFFTSTYAKTCHEAGAIVIVDEGGKESWTQLMKDGADGIQTDYPAELIAFLERRSK